MKIIFLVSGGGGSLKFINEIITRNNLPCEIAYVISDRSCDALEYARTNNLPHSQIKYNKENRSTLRELLLQLHPDIIVTNIHKVIDPETLALFQNKFINLHYSLLPAFSGIIGMRTVDEARKMNTQFLGATCHYVNEQLDGGKIISQCAFSVDWNQPFEIIVDTIFQAACLILANSILLQIPKKLFNETDRQLIINSNNVIFSPVLNYNGRNALSIFPLLKFDRK